MCVRLDSEEGDDKPKATIESRRFRVEIDVEGICTERARRELRLSAGWKITSDGSLHDVSLTPALTAARIAPPRIRRQRLWQTW